MHHKMDHPAEGQMAATTEAGHQEHDTHNGHMAMMDRDERRARWAHFANIGLGLWLASSPLIYDAATTQSVGDAVLSVTADRGLPAVEWRAGALGLSDFLSGFALAFFGANAIKIPDGGWFPLLIGIIVFTLLSTWKQGRKILLTRLQTGSIALEPFIRGLMAHPPTRVPGTAVFLTASKEGVPHALLHNLKHNKVLHERVVFLTVVTEPEPYVSASRRLEVENMGNGFYRLFLHYGFKDSQHIPKALLLCKQLGLEFDMMQTSFFLSRETIISTGMPGMAPWREHLFIAMARNAESAMSFFHIPTNRVIELGSQVEI